MRPDRRTRRALAGCGGGGIMGVRIGRVFVGRFPAALQGWWGTVGCRAIECGLSVPCGGGVIAYSYLCWCVGCAAPVVCRSATAALVYAWSGSSLLEGCVAILESVRGPLRAVSGCNRVTESRSVSSRRHFLISPADKSTNVPRNALVMLAVLMLYLCSGFWWPDCLWRRRGRCGAARSPLLTTGKVNKSESPPLRA